MNIRRTLITAGTAAAFILGLTGCAAPGDAVDGVLDPLFGGATATATPTATPTPTPLAGDLDANGKIDTWEAEQLAKGSYKLADGSVVKVDPTKPFAAPVIASIKREAAPLASKMNETGESRRLTLVALMGQADAVTAETGRGVTYVYLATTRTHDANGNPADELVWATTASDKSRGTGIAPSANKASLLAEARSWSANRNYEVIGIG
ncbi:hypothetical protein E3T54_11935 [Cryobacterium sp. Sr8]|uniref:hypothetical protein n=1 Tax=Cryobacterium sp. Sr8 TaxID=1259203 RepID=UPI00106D5BC3|nr:hypothetical protein [Cryobacterium sp. Sr8]TFD75436.1 hypothetical protein E3T54_11935 [Cryobacterium sp. Sr8]